MIKPKKQKSSAMSELMDEIDAQMEKFRRGFDPGERVSGTVVSVGTDYIVVDINSKMQGIIDISQWPADKDLPEEGDGVEAYFVEVRSGTAQLAVSIAGSDSAVTQSLRQAYETQLPVEGKYVKEINGGYEVNIAGQRAFCPFSQVSLYRRDDNEESLIGQSTTFIVIEFDPEEHTIVVSHRAVLERDRAEKREVLKEQIREGDLIEGTVTKIMPFGVFVDVGGIEGLIPMREISWDRTVKAEDFLEEGQTVKVSVLSLDWEADRFSFSLREAVEDPWNTYTAQFSAGDYVTGKVVKLMPYGAFVQLVPGVEGLIPISKLGSGRRISHPRECLKEDEELDLQIDSIDLDLKRISLKVADERIQELSPGEIAAAAHLRGIVEGIREFGIFVRLSEDKTGLLHISECDIERGGNPVAKLETKFPGGSEIEVVGKSIDGDRISLTLPGKDTSMEQKNERESLEALMHSNSKKADRAAISTIGSMLDDLLK